MAQELEEAYADFNRRYFEGKLPAIPVRWGRCSRDEIAHFRWSAPGGVDGIITISPRLKFSSTVWKRTLLHEMGHVELCDHPSHAAGGVKSHGKAWTMRMRRLYLAEIKRLVDAGAFDVHF